MTSMFGKAKAMCVLVVMGFGLLAQAATLTVTSVTAQQRYPWNGLVDIVVTFNGDQSDAANANCTFAAADNTTKNALAIAHVTQQGNDTGYGTTWARRFIWDTNADLGEVKIDDVEVVADVDTSDGVQLWKGGPYWATCNVGASKPEEHGFYFCWGDTEGHAGDWHFDSDHCSTSCKSESELRSLGYIDSTGNLAPAHDAARKHLGAPWRMPTDAEFGALVSNCDTIRTTRNGVNGRLVTGRGAYSSKSIFLPAAGFGFESILHNFDSNGYYWSSTLYLGNLYDAGNLFFGSGFYCGNIGRSLGHSVRPVRGFAESTHLIHSTHLSLDTRPGTRVAKATEQIRFSPEWIPEPSLFMTATVRANGTVLKSATEPGVFEWKPRLPGTYVLTHTVSSFDQQAGETLSATFEVRPDCVIRFHANGGVFAGLGDDVTTFDQPFFYGEPQKLMTDELNPMRMDGSGNKFLGWVRGTPEISSSEELIYEDYIKTFEKGDATEEHFYAVWTTTLTVNFYNTISPSSLDDHLKWQVIGKESSDTLKSGESIEVSPGEREIWLYVDAAYDWLVEGFDLGWPDSQNFNAYQGILTLNFSNDYTLYVIPNKSTRNVVAGVKYRSVGSRICFSCKHKIRESLCNQIKTSDVPFRASKVSITIEGTRFNESGILEPAPAHVLTGLKPGEEYFLPKGIYRIKSVTYDADQRSGDPYWGAVLDANQTFEVGAAEPIDYVDIDFDLFGGEDVVMVLFDSQEGACEKSRMWYTPAYHDIDGVPHYRIYRMPPDPKKAGFEFENWYTAPTGGREIKLQDDIIDCTLFAHWETKVTEDWLLLYPRLAAIADGDVETATSMTAANGCRTVGECYELGINPENPNDDLKIIGFEMKDGKPVIQLNHTKDGSGNSFESRIKTLGKASLSDAEWVDVTDTNLPGLRFFKAMVDLP